MDRFGVMPCQLRLEPVPVCLPVSSTEIKPHSQHLLYKRAKMMRLCLPWRLQPIVRLQKRSVYEIAASSQDTERTTHYAKPNYSGIGIGIVADQ